jgi:hypothetical protein
MNLESILDELRSQRTQLDQAIAALQGTTRPFSVSTAKRRGMSAAARARIGAAKKAWWAKQKRKTGAAKSKPTLIHGAKRKPMSPATRKKLSTLMKTRWAAKKKAA